LNKLKNLHIHSKVVLKLVGDGDTNDLNWGQRSVIAVCLCTVDSIDNVHASFHFPEDWMLGGSGLVPKIKEGVVDSVNKKLTSWRENFNKFKLKYNIVRTSTIWLSSVGHGESSRFI
jgi:hypothetical protein